MCACLHISITCVFMPVSIMCVHIPPLCAYTCAHVLPSCEYACIYVHASIVMCVPELCACVLPGMCMYPYTCAVSITCACACLLPSYVPVCVHMCPYHVYICAYPIMCTGSWFACMCIVYIICACPLMCVHRHVYVCVPHQGFTFVCVHCLYHMCIPFMCVCVLPSQVCMPPLCVQMCKCVPYMCIHMPIHVPPSHLQVYMCACTCLHHALHVSVHVCACDGGGARVLEVDQKGRSTGRNLRTKTTTTEVALAACPLCRPAKYPSCQSGSWFPSGRDCGRYSFSLISPPSTKRLQSHSLEQ